MTCPNCNKDFDIILPSTVGHEGATSGVYCGGDLNVVYKPCEHRCYPLCPHCERVDFETPLNPERP